MPVSPPLPEFWFPHLDTLVRVETDEGSVTIRATRPSFSERRKLCFIRELAAEGFISDDDRWLTLLEPPSSGPGVRWLVDVSWLEIDRQQVEKTQRTVFHFALPAALLWLLMLGWAVPRSGQTDPVKVPVRSWGWANR